MSNGRYMTSTLYMLSIIRLNFFQAAWIIRFSGIWCSWCAAK